MAILIDASLLAGLGIAGPLYGQSTSVLDECSN